MSTNQAVTDFLNYYIDLEAPEYAVMLKGEWGSGKTWFIKNFLKHKYKTDSDKNLYLYQSLYGIGSITELENCIFGQLNPFWTSKIGKIGSRVLGLAAKNAALSQGVSGEVKTDDLIDKLKKLSGRVIIFDDLERSKIPLIELLGYINQFVEHDGYRVILLANEIAIEEDAAYTTTKEKLVGRTFGIATDVNAALASFLVGIKTLSIKTTFEKNLALIIKIYEQSGYGNLRILKHSLHDFERICDGVDTNALSCEPLMTEFLQSFLCLAFEIKKGTIAPPEIEALMSTPMRAAMSSLHPNKEQSPEEKKLSEIAKKYDGVIKYSNPSVNTGIWKEIFDTGFAPVDKLNEAFANSKYFINQNRADWVNLWNSNDLTDAEFEPLLQAVYGEWKNMGFTDSRVVLHVAGILMRCGNFLEPKLTKKSVLKQAKSHITKLKKLSLLKGKAIGGHSDYIDRTSSHGLGYTSKDEPEFTELWIYLSKTQESVQLESYPQIAKNLLTALASHNTDAFGELLSSTSNIQGVNLSRFEILKHVNKQSFFDCFLDAEPTAQTKVFWAFHRRYEHLDPTSPLLLEQSWLVSFNTKLSSAISKRKKLNSGLRFASLQEHYLKPILQKFNAISEKIPKSLPVQP